MKAVACLVVALVAVTLSQDTPKDKDSSERPGVFQRLIPADVLRGKHFEIN